MAEILFRSQCDDDEDDDEDDESDKWNPACVTCLYKQIITYIWCNVDKYHVYPYTTIIFTSTMGTKMKSI